jgi:hypothetical protein
VRSCVCDLETSRMRSPWPALGRSAIRKENLEIGYILRFKKRLQERENKMRRQSDKPVMCSNRHIWRVRPVRSVQTSLPSNSSYHQFFVITFFSKHVLLLAQKEWRLSTFTRESVVFFTMVQLKRQFLCDIKSILWLFVTQHFKTKQWSRLQG